jgi:hypothetical protein
MTASFIIFIYSVNISSFFFSFLVFLCEKSLTCFLNGPGEANYFQIPEWQQKAVDRYLQFLGPDEYKDLYNRTGRGYPDVSAQGSRYAIAWRQTFLSGKSKSCFCPRKHDTCEGTADPESPILLPSS